MMKIDTSGWKEFIIGDLFEKLQLDIKKEDFNKTFDVSEERTEEFNLPLVNAKHGNNGIMYYGREADFETAGMTIDIVQNGAIATGDVYAQPQRTGVLWDAYLVKPKAKIDSAFTLMFLATVLEKAIKDKFSYDDKCVWDKAKLLTVTLPCTREGEPDWAYMDEYMSAVMGESGASLENMGRVEKEFHPANASDWRQFSIGSLFEIEKGTRLTRAAMIEGDTPFIGATLENNGITARIGNTGHIHPGGLMTVAYNGQKATGKAFYQPISFWASDDVNVLYPKFSLTENIALFLAPLFWEAGRPYSFGDKWGKDVMESDYLTLPANASGEPDWDYMDKYMRTIMESAKSDLAAMQSIRQ